MIDHLLIVETRPGTSEVLRGALESWDAGHAAAVISFPGLAGGPGVRDCHTLFLLAVEKIEALITERNIRPTVSRVVAVADYARWPDLDPIDTAGKYYDSKSSPVTALLILAFPEILWGFAQLDGAEDAPRFIQRVHLLGEWLSRGQPPQVEPLMDTSGLRNHVRARASANLKQEESLSVRESWAVALDDESAFAFFNAYTAYRQGFRGAPIFTEAAADYLLKADTPSEIPALVCFEDLYISFPDSSNNNRLSDLNSRDLLFPVLAAGKFRVILTSGHKQKGREDPAPAIRARKAVLLLKPTGGMFSIWKKSKLLRNLQRHSNRHGVYAGYAPGFLPDVLVDPSQEGMHHSAPGALLSIAEVLLERAQRCEAGMGMVQDVLRSAVLATDAFELLAGRTPTLSLDALTLKHELEAKAECIFNGVQNHFDIGSRLKSYQKSIAILSKWHDPWNQDVAKWNAELVVLNRLKGVFAEYEQFDESERCNARSRTLHRLLYFRRRLTKPIGTWLRWLNPAYWIAAYVSFLLSSISWFVIIVLLWIASLTMAFRYVENDAEHVRWQAHYHKAGEPFQSETTGEIWTNALTNSFSSFVSVGAPIGDSWKECSRGRRPLALAITCVGMAAGFLHMGIFISHLYNVISRKN